MAFWRRHLRAFAATWLVFQAAWLIALVPRDCCAAHRLAETSCHESTSTTHCPMRAADGTPCPMHRGHSSPNSDQIASVEHHHEAARVERHHHAGAPERKDQAPLPTDCRLTGACDGPMAVLFGLLSNHGILPEAGAFIPNVEVRRVSTAVHDDLGGRFQPPDPPPPRA
jgi:hypothetical protein